uniref:Uncharacterized protein n=1 Tax=Acrobeloides nanus TaxID=290746 RepID=A0A914DQL1_9BILA
MCSWAEFELRVLWIRENVCMCVHQAVVSQRTERNETNGGCVESNRLDSDGLSLLRVKQLIAKIWRPRKGIDDLTALFFPPSNYSVFVVLLVLSSSTLHRMVSVLCPPLTREKGKRLFLKCAAM